MRTMKEWMMVAVSTLLVTLATSQVDAQTPGPV
ncbi:MAG: hypothetical protein JWO52_6572, partial [Gammaproteobacteria bacterium]|nr:hypothetical protein [Gammaproteobacteria bacterium]